MAKRAAAVIALAATALIHVGCSGEDVRYNDSEIVEELKLEKTSSGFAVDGDPFCEVKKQLLNTADEVTAAAEKEDLGLVIASKARNAGIQGLPPFAPECADEAKKKLDRLDPEAED